MITNKSTVHVGIPPVVGYYSRSGVAALLEAIRVTKAEPIRSQHLARELPHCWRRSADLGMAGAEANIGSGVVPVAAEFHRHHELGGGVVYPNIGASWRQLGPVLVGPQLPDGVVRVHDNDGYYSVLQPRPGANVA